MMKKLLIGALALASIAVIAAGCGGEKKAAPAAEKKVALIQSAPTDCKVMQGI